MLVKLLLSELVHQGRAQRARYVNGPPNSPHRPLLLYTRLTTPQEDYRVMHSAAPMQYPTAMSDAPDLTGRAYGRLVARTRVTRTGRFPRELWLCACACGTTPLIQREALLDGSVTACGPCSHAEALQRASRRMLVDPASTKVCNRCQGEQQPLSAFPPHRSTCRRCIAAYTAAWRTRKSGGS